MRTPPIVSRPEWDAARAELLVKEKETPPYQWWRLHDEYGNGAQAA